MIHVSQQVRGEEVPILDMFQRVGELEESEKERSFICVLVCICLVKI